MVNVIRLATKEEVAEISKTYTTHFLTERLKRYAVYKSLLDAKYVLNLICDTGHKNGYEIHRINENAICEIYNLESKRLITLKALRPRQLYRYYNGVNLTPPKNVIENAIINVNLSLNNI